MKHHKPLCDCGNELLYEVDKVIASVRYKITNKGELYKHPMKLSNWKAEHGEDYSMGRLYCEKCSSTYEYDYDFTVNRVIRGIKLY